MSDRIPPRNTRPTERRLPASTGKSSAGSSHVDQAAQQFASLLGGELLSTDDQRPGNDGGDNASDAHGKSDRVDDQRDERDAQSDTESSQEQGSGQREPAVQSMGEQILESLGAASRSADVNAAQGAPQIDNVVQQIVDKMLVSDPASGTREVRIMLKQSIMAQTEIRISQQAGRLQVQFVTESAKSQQLLAHSQELLQQRLNDRLSKHDVVVNVALAGHGDQQDGRSRQQRHVEDEQIDE